MFNHFTTFVSIFISILCYHTIDAINICEQMRAKDNSIFDYAYFMKGVKYLNYYLFCSGGMYRIGNYSEALLEVNTTGNLIFEPFGDKLLFSLYKTISPQLELELRCFYIKKPDIIPKFKCELRNITSDKKLGAIDSASINCQIDVESTVAYYPKSYLNSQNNVYKVLLVHRKQRSVWKTDWRNVSPNRTVATCVKVDSIDLSIPQFLYAIDHSLQITGIIGITYKRVYSALVLFYHNGRHKFCVTRERQLSDDCKPGNLRNYLNECYNEITHTTEQITTPITTTRETMLTTITTEQITTPITTTTQIVLTTSSTVTSSHKNLTPTIFTTKTTESSNEISSSTSHAQPSSKSKPSPNKTKSFWFVIAIIIVLLVVAAIIIGICFLIYSVYRSKNKSQTAETNDGSDEQISDSTHESQQQSESSDQKDESNVG